MTQAKEYTLKPKDLKVCYSNGQQRDNKGFEGTVDIDSTDAHIIGLKGEIAFAELYGVDPDLSYNPTGGDDGHDFEVLWSGDKSALDVKVTTYAQDPWLKVRANRIKEEIDAYVLGTIVDHGISIQFVGWATPQMLLDGKRTQKTGSDNYILEQEELKPMPQPTEIAKA